MAIRLVAIVCSLALVAALAEGVSAQRAGTDPGASIAKKKRCKRGQVRRHGKCRKRPRPHPQPKAPLHSGNYVDSQNRLAVDIAAKTVRYHFYQPCNADGGGLLYGQTEVDGATFALPGDKVGTALDLTGAYTTPRYGASQPETTNWHMAGKWTSASRFDGTLQFTVDVPAGDQSAPAHCDYPATPIHLNG